MLWYLLNTALAVALVLVFGTLVRVAYSPRDTDTKKPPE